MKYIIGIDQSTQGTKTILFDETGKITAKVFLPHRQKIDENGFVSHDIEEIYANVIETIKRAVKDAKIKKEDIVTLGISNQRETTAIWDKSGKPLCDAVVWQCSRASKIAEERKEYKDMILEKTGLPLSPYFPAAKMKWLLNQLPDISDYCIGTIDSWLIYKLTRGKSYKTDYTNASRTQLFNIHNLTWDGELCDIFGIPVSKLPKVCDSDAYYGETDLEGFLKSPISIHSAMGDSHAALWGQGCHKVNMIKTTYGTGSSIMMNTGEECRKSQHGLATSIAWARDGKVNYVLEGNINYTGAVISWLQNDLELIKSPEELEPYISKAKENDTTIVIPAFTGLSAPHWCNDAKAMIYGMTRTTGKAEIIKASVESIAHQIQDVLQSMEQDGQSKIIEMRVDGGPTKNKYLMQFQSDVCQIPVEVSKVEELSVIGVAYMAGIACGIYKEEEIFKNISYQRYQPKMELSQRKRKRELWNQGLHMVKNK